MKKNSAFSLIELSIVILIIGILVAGVTQSSRLVSEMRLTTARSLTQSSPVPSIKNLTVWLDATSEKGILDAEANNGSAVSKWTDTNVQNTSSVFYSAGATSPTYKRDCINSLPCIDFPAGAVMNVNTSYGIPSLGTLSAFMVVKTTSDVTTTNTTAIYTLGTPAQGAMLLISGFSRMMLPYDQSNGNGIVYTTGALLALVPSQNYVISIVDNGTTMSSYYNGAVAVNATSSVPAINNSKPLTSAVLGSASNTMEHWVGEIIIYNKSLTSEERKAVEKYLGQKWGIKVS